jgi:hypothetical protein
MEVSCNIVLFLTTDSVTVNADLDIPIPELPVICPTPLIHLDKGRVCLYTVQSHMAEAHTTASSRGSGMEGTKSLLVRIGPRLPGRHSVDD